MGSFQVKFQSLASVSIFHVNIICNYGVLAISDRENNDIWLKPPPSPYYNANLLDLLSQITYRVPSDTT